MSAACGWCHTHKFRPRLPSRRRVSLWAKGATSLQNEFYKKVALALMEQALAAIKIKAFRDDLCGPAPPGPASPSPPARAGECAPQGRVLSHPAPAAADERWWPHPQSVVRPGPLCAAGVCGYAAMKGAVEVLSRYLAQELRPRGIARRHRPAGGRPAAARHTLVECAAQRGLGRHVSVMASDSNAAAWRCRRCLRLWRLSNKR